MQITVKVAPRKIVKYLVIGIIFFAVVSTGIQISKYVFDYRDEWMKLFNLDRELNFPTWYSALMLGFCGLLLRIIAMGKKQQSDRYTSDWQLLSVIFGLMALDEILSIHEVLIIPEISEALNLPWFLHSMWVIPGVAFVVWFGKRYRKFVSHLPARSKRQFILAAMIYIGGALIMEMIGSHFAEAIGQQHLIYALIATVEEVLEMTGTVVFIYGLLFYLGKWTPQLDLHLDIL
ncbi:MAG: hypothetical protein AAGE84_01465 [Cyanobacteria bacterium P01_G01_bin.39]